MRQIGGMDEWEKSFRNGEALKNYNFYELLPSAAPCKGEHQRPQYCRASGGLGNRGVRYYEPFPLLKEIPISGKFLSVVCEINISIFIEPQNIVIYIIESGCIVGI